MTAREEWQRGWRIVLGCALGSGTGVVLLFFTFSLFILPIIEEFGGSRGDMGDIQALIVAGALGSPILGRLTDRLGFRNVYFGCVAALITIELSVAFLISNVTALAVSVFFLGLLGVGTTALTVTRPVNAWFDGQRGLALGVTACGTAITTIFVPPFLEAVIATEGWRMGYVGLASLAAFVGVPAVYFLVANEPPEGVPAHHRAEGKSDWSFLGGSTFWVMALGLIIMNMAGAGFVGQLSPMIQEEGLTAQIASFAVSAFAFGQLVGRLFGGWCLDRFNPRSIVILLNLIPALGYVILWGQEASVALALTAALMIGFQQGAELDIFAFFTARRYGVARYGTVYGTLQGLGWIGNATGVIGVGRLHDIYGSYSTAQMIGAAALCLGAILLSFVRLPEREPRDMPDVRIAP